MNYHLVILIESRFVSLCSTGAFGGENICDCLGVPLLAVIDRYILRETLKVFFAIFIVITLVVLVQGYIKILQQAALGALDSRLILSMVGLRLLEVIGPIVPPTFFFSILYSLGRMYRDSEVTALAASGVGVSRIFRAYLLAALPVTILVAYLTLSVLPWAKNIKSDLVESQQQELLELSTTVAGRFNEYSRGEVVFYVEDMSEDKTKLRNIFVQNRKNDKLSLISAAEGYRYTDPKTNSQYVVLTNGRRYEGRPGQKDFMTGEFEKYAMRIDEGTEKSAVLRPDQMPTRQLIGAGDIRMQSELQYRLMLPVAVIVFTLISIPLSKSLPRQGMYGSLILAILLYALFMNLQALSGNWMIMGTTPAWLGRWWVHVVILLITGIALFFRSTESIDNIKRLLRLPA